VWDGARLVAPASNLVLTTAGQRVAF
jgi:hypothetical protein